MVDHLRQQYTSLHQAVEKELEQIKQTTKNLQHEIEQLTIERDELGIAPHKLPGGRVLLDVGGIYFSTTLDTLTKVPDSHLGRMFSGRFPVHVNEDDRRVFIDRDGTHFHYILNFLRDPENNKIKLRDRIEMEELKVEIEYFGLAKAVFGDVNLSIPDNLDWIDNNQIKVHSFSSQLSGFPASNTLNPSMTYWLSESGTTMNQWIVYEMPGVCFVNKIMIKVDTFECTAKDWMVQTTEEDDPLGQWNTIKDFQAKCGNSCTSDQFFEEFEVRAKYIRLFFKDNWGPGGGSYILVTNVKFFGGILDD